MVKFLEKLMGKSAEEDYAEVDLGQFEELEEESPEILLRFAELGGLEALPYIKQEIYSGNIVLVDIAGMKRDKASVERALGELRKAVEDVSGDIAGIGDDLVVAVPNGVRIDREKVIGGRD
jgi:SepF-like predicted cell division protein (DUF552 family)